MRLLIAAALAALPLVAAAHPGHGEASSFAQGFAHPFTGVDHLLAMLAVGVWSALVFERRAWLLPLTFAAMLLAGALWGVQPLGWVEPAIAASLLCVGLLVATGLALPLALGALLVGGFALAHGAAHGSELAHGPAFAGMVLASALLHAAGLLAGRALRVRERWLRASLGSGVALFGAALLVA